MYHSSAQTSESQSGHLLGVAVYHCTVLINAGLWLALWYEAYNCRIKWGNFLDDTVNNFLTCNNLWLGTLVLGIDILWPLNVYVETEASCHAKENFIVLP